MKLQKVKFEGLSQYRPPLCFELSGKTFELAMDNGYDYTVKFLDNSTVEWGEKGGKARKDAYECLKGDDTTYFVNWEVVGAKPRQGMSLILDMDNSLVTAVVAYQGKNPKFPYMVNTDIIFGAIQREGQPLPFRRHGYTDEMLGNAVEWCYNPDFRIMHMYTTEHYYRVGYTPRNISPEQQERMRQLRERRKNYPQSEEPSYYIKIKKGLYLFGFIEEHEELLLSPAEHGNNMIFLMNLERLMDVGRSFGTNDQGILENYVYGAYGSIVEPDEERFNAPSAYLIN